MSARHLILQFIAYGPQNGKGYCDGNLLLKRLLEAAFPGVNQTVVQAEVKTLLECGLIEQHSERSWPGLRLTAAGLRELERLESPPLTRPGPRSRLSLLAASPASPTNRLVLNR